MADGGAPKPVDVLLSKMVAAVRAGIKMPKGANFEYFQTFPEFKHGVAEQSEAIVEIIQSVVGKISIANDIAQDGGAEGLQRLTTAEMLHGEGFRYISDISDKLLSIIDADIDTLAGETGSSGMGARVTRGQMATQVASGRHTASGPGDNEKPQLKFTIPVDNSAEKPWFPSLKEKPNAIVPYEPTNASTALP